MTIALKDRSQVVVDLENTEATGVGSEVGAMTVGVVSEVGAMMVGVVSEVVSEAGAAAAMVIGAGAGVAAGSEAVVVVGVVSVIENRGVETIVTTAREDRGVTTKAVGEVEVVLEAAEVASTKGNLSTTGHSHKIKRSHSMINDNVT